MGCIYGIFLVLPKKWTGSFDDVTAVAYTIVEFGLPFLLYCFLQIPGDVCEIISRIFCFAGDFTRFNCISNELM
jgi:hypothetical protein